MMSAATLATACCLTQVGTAGAGMAGGGVCPMSRVSDAAPRTQFSVTCGLQGYILSFEETWWWETASLLYAF